ncbi:MAG: hypothetical protein ACOY46_05285 [Bacillota bacterium]
MLKEWVERNLQDPFFRAEMVKAEINVVKDADSNLGTVKSMAVLGSAYMAFCAYSYLKYVA